MVAGDIPEIWVGGETGLAGYQDGNFHTVRTADGSGFQSVTGIVAARTIP